MTDPNPWYLHYPATHCIHTYLYYIYLGGYSIGTPGGGTYTFHLPTVSKPIYLSIYLYYIYLGGYSIGAPGGGTYTIQLPTVSTPQTLGGQQLQYTTSLPQHQQQTVQQHHLPTQPLPMQVFIKYLYEKMVLIQYYYTCLYTFSVKVITCPHNNITFSR